MHRFVINTNAQANGDHEVHNASTGCTYMPDPQSVTDLGYHPGCQSAVADAKGRWPGSRINGCYFCARSCHTT